MTAGEFCTREVVVTEKEASIVEVAQLMREHHVGDIIVVDRKGEQTIPLGIVTDRDLAVEIVARQVNPDEVTAGDIMSFELVSVLEDTGIWEALLQMRGKGVRRMPVVNGNGGLEGILSLDDLVELLAEELSLLAKVAASGQAQERKKLD